MQLPQCESENPVIHLFTMRLARKLVSIIEPCLRPEEKHCALTEIYEAIRLDLGRYERESQEKRA